MTESAPPRHEPSPEAVVAAPAAPGAVVTPAVAPAAVNRAPAEPRSAEKSPPAPVVKPDRQAASTGSSTPPAASTTPATPAPLAAPGREAPKPDRPVDDLERLRSGWGEIVAQVGSNPATRPVIAASRPVSVEGNIVTLGFPEEQAFYKDVAERRRSYLESGLGTFLGRAIALRFVVTNLDALPPLPLDDDETRILAEARRIFADDITGIPEVS